MAGFIKKTLPKWQTIDISHIYESLGVIGGLKERLKKRENYR